MGNQNSGRPRKPLELHRQDGTRPEWSTPAGARYPPGAPTKPPEVARRRVASETWDEITRVMGEAGTLSPAWAAALAAASLLYADAVRGGRGSRGAWAELRQWLSQLGLTPATASRAAPVRGADDERQQGPLAMILGGRQDPERRPPRPRGRRPPTAEKERP